MTLWRVHVELEDRPGRLGELATAVGEAGCNIISLHVVGEPADDGSVTDELLVRVPETADPSGLVGAIEAAGIPCSLLVRADATELADAATTALALARMVAADPGSAPRAVATMLRARLVDPADIGPAAPAHVHSLRVGAQQLHLGRAWPFTATELSRAAALLELAAQLALRPQAGAPREHRGLLLRDGSEVRLREVTASDGPLVAALHARCSPQTRRSRFLSPTPRLAPGQLAGLLGGADGTGRAVLAVTADGGSAVGLATVDQPGRRLRRARGARRGRLAGARARHGPAAPRGRDRHGRRRRRGDRPGPHRRRRRHAHAAPGRPAADGGDRRRHRAAVGLDPRPRHGGVALVRLANPATQGVGAAVPTNGTLGQTY